MAFGWWANSGPLLFAYCIKIIILCIMHIFKEIFCRLLGAFLNHDFKKKYFKIPSECLTVWNKIMSDALLGLTLVQNVCKGNQQMTQAGKELTII